MNTDDEIFELAESLENHSEICAGFVRLVKLLTKQNAKSIGSKPDCPIILRHQLNKALELITIDDPDSRLTD